jgi:hypothetical protein
MGLAEQIRSGAVLDRINTTLTTDVSGVGSVSLGSAYALLGIEVDTPCRIRFYDNVASRDDAGEINRAFGNTRISASIALVADISMSSAGKYTIDPVLYGMPLNFSNPITYYRVSPTAEIDVVVSTYAIEDSNISVGTGEYTINNRRELPTFTGGTLSAGAMVSGTIQNSTIPQTYLLISASLDNTAHRARLRLYSTSGSVYDDVEKARPFSTEPSASTNLIVDMILSGSEVTHFVPKIMGTNIQNISQNLSEIRGNESRISGNNELYYILQNVGTVSANINVSVHVYSLED